MMKRTLLAVAVVFAAIDVRAQSLAEAAAKAKDIVHEWPLSTNTGSAGPTTRAAVAGAKKAQETLGETDEGLKAKPEAWWRSRRKELQTKFETDVPPALAALKLWKAQVEAFRTAGVVRAAQATVEVAANSAQADYERLNAIVTADKADIDAFEELARTHGVIPGWLR
jgi:hypothetical protein